MPEPLSRAPVPEHPCAHCGAEVERWPLTNLCDKCAAGVAKPVDRSPDIERDDSDAFYERAAWPLGTIVIHPDDGRLGDLVRRTARAWVDRERKPPMVRWRGKIDAVEVPWWELRRAR